MNREKPIPVFEEPIGKHLPICNVVVIVFGVFLSQDNFKLQVTNGFDNIFVNHRVLYNQEFIIVEQIIIYSRVT